MNQSSDGGGQPYALPGPAPTPAAPASTPPGVVLQGPGGWRVALPAALIMAIVTAISSAGAVQCSSAGGGVTEDVRRDMKDVQRGLADVQSGQRQLLERFEREATTAANARAVQDIANAARDERLRKVEAAIR